jgi:Ser/Thr protein kinase RdoA (MazF antagonist)
VEEILADYDLELVKRPRMLGGRGRSRSLIVDTPQGKKVLKGYKHTVAQPTIVHEHSILRYLAQVDFPVPRLVATCTGETVVCKGESHYALFDFIKGGFQYHNYILLPAQARQFITIAGKTLAVLHSRLKDFMPEGYNPNGFKSQTESRWRDLEWYMSRLAHCVEETQRLKAAAGGTQATWLLQQAGRMEKALLQLDRTLKEAALPRLIIHADYGPYNMLFRHSGPVIVLDFEIARLDWRVSEFVYALPRFAHRRFFGLDFGEIRCFLDAYQSHLSMSDDELRFIPSVWQFLNIRRAIVCWHRYCETHANQWLLQARHNLRWVNWVTNNQDDFLNHLITT